MKLIPPLVRSVATKLNYYAPFVANVKIVVIAAQTPNHKTPFQAKVP